MRKRHSLPAFSKVVRFTQAANVLATVKRTNFEKAGKEWPIDEEEAFKKPILDKYEHESQAYYSSARLWDDGIIDPRQSRQVLGLSLASACNVHRRDTKFGVFRF